MAESEPGHRACCRADLGIAPHDIAVLAISTFGPHSLLSAHGTRTLEDVELVPPVVLCLGAERGGLPPEREREAVRIDVRSESLNVAMAAGIALYETARRMRGHG